MIGEGGYSSEGFRSVAAAAHLARTGERVLPIAHRAKVARLRRRVCMDETAARAVFRSWTSWSAKPKTSNLVLAFVDRAPRAPRDTKTAGRPPSRTRCGCWTFGSSTPVVGQMHPSSAPALLSAPGWGLEVHNRTQAYRENSTRQPVRPPPSA